MKVICIAAVMVFTSTSPSGATAGTDADQDGLPDSVDACPTVEYLPGFDWLDCAPMDQDPDNDPEPECRARERVFEVLHSAFVTHIAFAVVRDDAVHFADAFTYLGGGDYAHDPGGVTKLYRIGSTSKSVTAVTAKILEEQSVLSLDDFVSDDDATQVFAGGERTVRDLLTHQGAFKLDNGALHLFCYPQDLIAFWEEPDDLVSPHYDSPTYGNLGGGFAYSAFNYSLAGAHLTIRSAESFEHVLQTRLFDVAGMCTATLDGSRAVNAPIGEGAGTSQAAVMHVGPYINQLSPIDTRCEDNFYSSDDLPGDDYTWQLYHLDEASAEARDPAGGVMASVIDMAHFARSLLASYHGTGGVLSADGVRELWAATSDLGCHPNCPYERYYGVGFFTDSAPSEPVAQVGHGGSRAGYTSAFVLRPEDNLAVAVLANADLSTVAMSDLAKAILDDFESVVGVGAGTESTHAGPRLSPIGPNPLRADHATAMIRFSLPREAAVRLDLFDVQGRLVGTIAREKYPAGDHVVRWRATDRDLAPGTYFVRLAALDAAHVRKLIVSE